MRLDAGCIAIPQDVRPLKQIRSPSDSLFAAISIRVWQVQPSALLRRSQCPSAASGAFGFFRFSTTLCGAGGRKNRSNSYVSVENEAE